mmetsp:Transcript_22054/g.54551  ORF Transcript_22054/g.54551 Transcript_22054/m.54551 type:complete len:311 (-) Transcript_22054:605-1537(-)
MSYSAPPSSDSDPAELLASAESLLASASSPASGLSSILSIFSSAASPETKAAEAAELFTSAANAYKLAKAWRSAGDAFMRASDAQGMAGERGRYYVATSAVDAAKAYKNVEKGMAVKAYRRAVEVFMKIAKFNQAAKNVKELGDLLEETGEIEAAVAAYRQAIDLYDAEEASSSANAIRIRCGELLGSSGRYADAAVEFETAATYALSQRLLRFSAKDYLLKAAVCLMCVGDGVALERAVDKYVILDPGFGESREGKLVKELTVAVAENDADAFTDALREHDKISRLDPWMTSMMLNVKKSIAAVEEDLC